MTVSSQRKYRTLINDVLDTSKDGIFVLDKAFRVVWVNSTLESFFGLRREEVVGRDKRALIRHRIQAIFEDPGVFSSRVLATYEDNTYVEGFECRVLGGEGLEERWLQHWSQPIRRGLYAGGRVEHYTDISSRKRVEEQRERYRRQLQVLTSNLAAAGEREHRRIAVELHDRLGQNLASALIKVGALAEARRGEAGAGLITDLRSTIREAIDLTRSMAFELSPPFLYELGFEAAVEWLADQVSGNHGIACSLECRTGRVSSVGEELAVAMYQAVRELLNNVVKHSGASEARIVIEELSNQLRISVRDNGAGFDDRNLAAPAHQEQGLGLFGIRERFRLFGGKVEIESRPRHGVKVCLVAPLRPTSV